MKILYVLPLFCNRDQITNFQTLGGGERYPFELARFLASNNKTDHVQILLFGEKESNFTIDGVTISVIKGFKPFELVNQNFSPFPSSLSFFKNISRADIIHGYHIKSDTITLSSLTAKLYNKPIVLTDFGGGGRLNISKIIGFESLAKAVLCISDFDSTFWHVKNKPTIYGGVDLEKYQYTKDKKQYVLYAGRILPHKGIDLLIQAIPKDYKLIIAGRVFNKVYLEHLKKIAGNKNITFIENPNDKELVNLYQYASCFVLPSTHTDYTGKKYKKTELFGLVAIEAMASGTPIIVSSAASLPELVKTGYNGFIFQDGDVNDLRQKLTQIITDKKLILSMGKNARKLAEEKYSWKNVAKKVREIYLQVIEQ
jgi:glycosyltransferase involved in cell wall biosynthesis